MPLPKPLPPGSSYTHVYLLLALIYQNTPNRMMFSPAAPGLFMAALLGLARQWNRILEVAGFEAPKRFGQVLQGP